MVIEAKRQHKIKHNKHDKPVRDMTLHERIDKKTKDVKTNSEWGPESPTPRYSTEMYGYLDNALVSVDEDYVKPISYDTPEERKFDRSFADGEFIRSMLRLVLTTKDIHEGWREEWGTYDDRNYFISEQRCVTSTPELTVGDRKLWVQVSRWDYDQTGYGIYPHSRDIKVSLMDNDEDIAGFTVRPSEDSLRPYSDVVANLREQGDPVHVTEGLSYTTDNSDPLTLINLVNMMQESYEHERSESAVHDYIRKVKVGTAAVSSN